MAVGEGGRRSAAIARAQHAGAGGGADRWGRVVSGRASARERERADWQAGPGHSEREGERARASVDAGREWAEGGARVRERGHAGVGRNRPSRGVPLFLFFFFSHFHFLLCK
jgi:hypothetical protein